MSRKIDSFMVMTHEPGSYSAVLQTFLRERRKSGSPYTVERLFYNLSRVGSAAGGDLGRIDRDWLAAYVDELWLNYAPDTIRTAVGDIRQFFRWLKKRRVLKRNMAKKVKPVRKHARRHRRVKAAPEGDIAQAMQYLVVSLREDELVYRELFGSLCAAESGWTDAARHRLRDLWLLTFLYETGARVGELARLGASVMDDTTAVMRPAYSITMVGKTNDRDRYFTQRTAELWRVWQAVRPDEPGADSRRFAVVGWNRQRPEPRRVQPRSISLAIYRRSAEAGVRPFRANALRHAKVKRTRQRFGIEMARVLIDHSNISTTEGYANVDDDEVTRATIGTGVDHDPWS